MGLLSFLKGLLNKQKTESSKTEAQIKVSPVVTPDPVVVDTEISSENPAFFKTIESQPKPERKKRTPKAEKTIKIEKKVKK